MRYLVRPPLALDRLTESTGGRLLYHWRPWHDGSTALFLEPLELLEWLAAFAPPPRRPLVRIGLLAPRARWRAARVLRVVYKAYELDPAVRGSGSRREFDPRRLDLHEPIGPWSGARAGAAGRL